MTNDLLLSLKRTPYTFPRTSLTTFHVLADHSFGDDSCQCHQIYGRVLLFEIFRKPLREIGSPKVSPFLFLTIAAFQNSGSFRGSCASRVVVCTMLTLVAKEKVTHFFGLCLRSAASSAARRSSSRWCVKSRHRYSGRQHGMSCIIAFPGESVWVSALRLHEQCYEHGPRFY